MPIMYFSLPSGLLMQVVKAAEPPQTMIHEMFTSPVNQSIPSYHGLPIVSARA